MKNTSFLLLLMGLLLLSSHSIHSQNTIDLLAFNDEFSKVSEVQGIPNANDAEKANTIKLNRYLISFDGNFQHYKLSYEQTIQIERIAATFGYFLNEKTMIGLGIQFSQEEDFLNILDNVGFGTTTNQIYKRKFQPFLRRYFYKKNNFTLFFDLSANIASEELRQYRNYYGIVNSSVPTGFEYTTFGAHLGLGLEYNLSEHFVLFTLAEAMQYRRDLNVAESSSDNIVLEDGMNMSLFRDLRVGVGYYF